ncbi:sigma-70 family RNA polymerase sigma factor [Rubritalea spongiae]|uniref:Sigma-70 family RNA polymerase sigma factor n=1 Tax=Rubritalea spongiae TaxID=430797 RepID=A0ABW5E3E7_9BACT
MSPLESKYVTDDLLISEGTRLEIYSFVVSRVRDPHLAEDLTQDILIKALKNYSSLQDDRRGKAWLFQIARNTIADYYRGAQGSVTFFDQGEMEESQMPMFQGGDGTSYFPEILSSFLRDVIDNLPPIYRDALCYTHCEGHSQVELAKQMGISISGAKSRVQRARAAVRDAVERCCLLETDTYGGVVEVEPRPGYCG